MEKNRWFKEHVDAVVIISLMFAGFVWMNGRFSDIHNKFSEIERDIAMIKTVLIVKEIYPKELAKSE